MGGHRNVEGCWGLPYENREFTKCPFHVFDQYEIHIQALVFVFFFKGIFIISRYTSSTFQLFKISKFHKFKTSKNQKFGIVRIQKFQITQYYHRLLIITFG